MRRLALLPLVALAVACSDHTLVQPVDDMAVATAQNGSQMVPFKGRKGEWWDLGSAFGCEGNPEYLRGWGAGVINVTHLGRSDYAFDNCWEIDPESPIGISFISQAGWVRGANGDELYWYASADMGTTVAIDLSALTYEQGPMWFTGGTGRFDGATGEFVAWGTLAEDFLTGTENWDGVISSVGSNKK